MLLANNILLIGFHILTGAKVLNTLSEVGRHRSLRAWRSSMKLGSALDLC
jgi:hypothetical protein